jgi:hypothetical protein
MGHCEPWYKPHLTRYSTYMHPVCFIAWFVPFTRGYLWLYTVSACSPPFSLAKECIALHVPTDQFLVNRSTFPAKKWILYTEYIFQLNCMDMANICQLRLRTS